MANDKEKAKDGWVSGGGVTLPDTIVLLELKLRGGHKFLEDILARKIAVAIATKHNIALSDAEIEAALSAFYGDRDLFEEAQIAAWLQSIRLEETSVRDYVCEVAIVRRAQSILITDDAVRHRFAAERYDYALAEVEVFSFPTTGQAREFILAVREKEAVAKDGERRQVTRREAPEEIAATLFSCDPGDLVGPVESDEGEYEVYMLRVRREPQLDDELRGEIRGVMFQQLIEAELIRDPMQFLK